MRYAWKTRLGRLVSAGVVATGLIGMPAAAQASPFSEIDMRLMIGSDGRYAPLVHMSDAFASETATLRTLNGLTNGACENTPNLRECLDAVSRYASGQSGVSAAHLAQALFIARSAVGTDDKQSFLPASPTVRAGIQEYCPDGKTPGYYFDTTTPYSGKRGEICVILKTKTAQRGLNPENEFWQYYWVSVAPTPQGFGYSSRNFTYKDNAFRTAATATGLKVPQAGAKNAEGKDFMVKLYAVGKYMQVEQYWESYGASPNWTKYVLGQPGMPPGIASIFEVDDSACIDMMFLSLPSAPTLDPGSAPPAYCLGRCKTPPLVNTGD